jgi:predicted small metal-binding protein
MSKVLRCKDVGMDCDFEVHAETENEILTKAAEHAKTEHNMEKIPPDVLTKVKASIKEESI